VGLAQRASYLPGNLSAGQKQRVAVARALAGDPALVIGDEPTAALDSQTAMSVMELLRERVTERSAVLVVTHDPRLQRFAHRTLHIDDGRLTGEEHHAKRGADA
jgi:putative ABC transport system ATP-binding protein